MTEDLELVKNVLKGNIESFNSIIRKYESAIYRYVLSMVKDKETAKDIVQEVFITVFYKLYTYSGQYKFSNWLYQIARNKSFDYIKKNKRIVQLDIENAWDVATKELMPEQSLEFKETKEELKNFMKTLDDVDRQILILKGLNENTKFIDIAEVLKISESTVKSKYYRIWKKYKSFIEKQEKRCMI